MQKDQGNDTNRTMLQGSQQNEENVETESALINWAKLITLICFTFGLIVLIWAISNAIQHMKGAGSGSVFSSFVDGGGLILGLFLFYVVAYGVAWYCGYGKRDQMRREAVEKQIAKERAMQALQNIQ